jgi:hypothetical protein
LPVNLGVTPQQAMTDQSLQHFFNSLADEELIARVKGGLTIEAHAIACAELTQRGIAAPIVEEPQEPADEPYRGDMVLLVRNLKPTEAHILSSCLVAAGIHAVPGDTHIVQTNSLWALAIGGAKVRVASSQLQDAQQILRSYRKGELSIGDDFDVGEVRE